MKKALLSVGAAISSLGLAAPAQAIIFTTLTANGNSIDTSASSPGTAAVDVGFSNFGDPRKTSVLLDLELESGDLGSELAFNSLIDNFGLENLRGIVVNLGGVTFSAIGSVAPFFSTGESVTGSAGDGSVSILFPGEGEPLGTELGNVFGGGSDFGIDIAGLSAGDSFTLEIIARSVPAPPALGLMLLGLAALPGRYLFKKPKRYKKG